MNAFGNVSPTCIEVQINSQLETYELPGVRNLWSVTDLELTICCSLENYELYICRKQ